MYAQCNIYCRAAYASVGVQMLISRGPPCSHADYSTMVWLRSQSYSAVRQTFTPYYRARRVLTRVVMLGSAWISAHGATERANVF